MYKLPATPDPPKTECKPTEYTVPKLPGRLRCTPSSAPRPATHALEQPQLTTGEHWRKTETAAFAGNWHGHAAVHQTAADATNDAL